MTIEIWSDVMCPFCYIGKRKFEAALAQFQHKDRVQVEWKSFQLMPDLETSPGKNLNALLVEKKGISMEQAVSMNNHVTQLARQIGLAYHLEQAIPANSFNAHRFTHFAKQHGRQDQAEEILFRAYFTDGKNIDDYPTLIQLGAEIGLDPAALKTALENGSFAQEVANDGYQARQVGVRGVPFFLLDGKYAVSGAQEVETFLQTIQKAYAGWSKIS